MEILYIQACRLSTSHGREQPWSAIQFKTHFAETLGRRPYGPTMPAVPATAFLLLTCFCLPFGTTCRIVGRATLLTKAADEGQ